MAYSQFKSTEISSKLGLNTVRKSILEPFPPPLPPSAWLVETLVRNQKVPLSSEKARNELLVSPILVELLNRNEETISLFSGINLDADASRGLNGECDFVITHLPHQFEVKAPIITLIEAKDENIRSGISQCAAQMYGALLMNQRDATGYTTIWGCVTTGTDWQFLRLENNELQLHTSLLYLNELDRILGVFQGIIGEV
jgi:hypothetical protein